MFNNNINNAESLNALKDLNRKILNVNATEKREMKVENNDYNTPFTLNPN